ncbi:MAG TPA: B12-binding domain-containing radical SAM protein [Terriglobia bacterium]|nr:B12-binding domain-containing radical SAM protein [Terriglobia bacterium]
MNVLLVYPEFPDTYWSFKHALPIEGKKSAYPPLGLLTIAAMMPAHWNKRLVDTNIRPLTDADLKWADVAMLSGMIVHKQELLHILDRCRARGLRTVIGGPVTNSVSELPQHADTVVYGEAEDLMSELIDDLERGRAKPSYKAAELPGLDKTPLPDLSLINTKYYSAMPIQYSRGCPFNCEFCDIIEIYGRKPRTKTPGQVITELDQLHDLKWRGSVFIVDDNFIGNKRKAKELLAVLADWNRRHRRPFSFFTEASVNLADDTELLEMMKDANFTRVFMGIETPVEESLKEAHKMQNTRKNLVESVRRIQSYGLEVMAGFIVGFDNDPEDIFDRQVQFIQESAIPLAMVGILLALPGTQLFRRLRKEGRILDEGHGDNMDLHLNFIPKMNAQKLIDGYRDILRRIYTPDAYYERVLRFLERYQSPNHRPRVFSDYIAVARSFIKQGVLGESRTSYWKFVMKAALHYRKTFDTAMTLAVMGYHFQTLTRMVLESE